MLVLLVEDEVPLAKLVCEYLIEEGIECDHAIKGKQGLQLIEQNDYDVLILDINLPDMSGFELCKQLRAQGINTPIIMLTARHSLEDKEQGFLAGTDDYLVKPFAMQELVMRLKALQQRGQRSDVLQLGQLKVEVSKTKATIADHVVALTPDEWRLLLFLIREKQTVSKSKLLEHLWPDDSGSEDGLKMLVFRLRKTIANTLADARLKSDALEIKTLRGIGLRIETANVDKQ